MESIYNHRKKAEKLIENIKNSNEISLNNKNSMLEFKDDCLSQNIGFARILKCLQILKKVSLMLQKDFICCNTSDIKALLAKIELMETISPRTKTDHRGVIKKFFKWLSFKGPDIDTSWIKTTFKKHNDKLPSELLNEQEVLKMINYANSSRDKAIISSLYESGCRIGEFLKLKIKDLIFDKPGCIFIVHGKTGGRRIRIINSEPYMIDWINRHPDNNNPHAYLWLNNRNNMLGYSAFCKSLRIIARKSKINKKVNPHNFRHARATFLASKFTEQQLKIFFGWTRGSDMASVYVHLSGKDVDDALLNLYGLKQDSQENKANDLKSIVCPVCKTQNQPTNKLCKLCGFPLYAQDILEIQVKESQNNNINQIMNSLFKDKEVLSLIERKIKDMPSCY